MNTHLSLLSRRTASCKVTGHYIPRNRTITGTIAELSAITAAYQRAGTLVAMTTPRPVTADRFQMRIRITEYRPIQPATDTSTTASPARRARPGRRIAVIATTVAGVIAGTLTVAAYLIGQLVEFLTAHAGLITAALALIGLLAAGLARTGVACVGVHCPGCPHH